MITTPLHLSTLRQLLLRLSLCLTVATSGLATSGLASTKEDALAKQKAAYSNKFKEVIVRFYAKTQPNMPVMVKPLELAQKVRRDQPSKVMFRFTNLSDKPQHIKAVHQVAPAQAEATFKKLVCFCFEEQTLQPKESKDMPVVYTLSTDLEAAVDTVELTYVVFPIDKEAREAVRADNHSHSPANQPASK